VNSAPAVQFFNGFQADNTCAYLVSTEKDSKLLCHYVPCTAMQGINQQLVEHNSLVLGCELQN